MNHLRVVYLGFLYLYKFTCEIYLMKGEPMICAKCRMAGVDVEKGLGCATVAQARATHNIPTEPKRVFVPAKRVKR